MVGASGTLVIGLLCLLSGVQSQRLIARQDQDSNLFFDVIPDKTTCETTMIQWNFFGRQAPMTLLVSNVGVPPSDATASPGPITRTLSTTITPFSGAFQWKVDVPPGTYRLNASLPSLDVVFQSGLFDVVYIPNGDLSCLQTSSSTSPPSTGTPAPSSQTSPAPGSSTSDNTEPTTSSSSTALPAQGGGRSNTGTIVGVVLGIVALGIVVLAAYFFIRRKKPSKAGHGSGKPGGGRWNGLGSSDSRTVLANATKSNGASRDRHSSSGQRRNLHFPGDSMASMQVTDESFGMGVGGEKYTSSRKNSAATTYEDHEGVVLATLPALPSNGRDAATGRRPSYPDGLYFDDRSKGISRSLQSTPYMESTNVSRAPSAAGTPYLSNGADMNPKTPPANTTDLKAHRNSIGAGNGRRRKPVPAYDPNDISPSAQASPIASPPTLVAPSPAITSAMLDHEASYTQQAPASSSGHYTTRTVNSRPDASDSSEGLAHKTSFGPPGVAEGKQLHYLMPDLPADVRNPRR